MWNTLLDNLKAISCSVVEQPIVEQPKTDANCVSTGLNVNNHLYTIPAMNH
jgi:hypothetical protein